MLPILRVPGARPPPAEANPLDTRPAGAQDGAVRVLLETERLILREFTADDLDALVELNSDPEVTFFINGGRVIPRAELASDYLPAYLGYHEKSPHFGFFVAQEK